MALSTAKLTELPFPPRFFSALPFSSRQIDPLSRFLFKPYSSSLRNTSSTKVTKSPSQKPHNSHSSSWLNKWSSSPPPPAPPPPIKQGSKKPDLSSDETHVGTTPIDRIVLRLRNLGLGSDDEDEDDEVDTNSSLNLGFDDSQTMLNGDEKLGDLLKRDWMRPDRILLENEDDDEDSLLPWERARGVNEKEEVEDKGGIKRRSVKTPSLAELTIEDEELRRLRRMGMTLRERINVPKAGITGEVLEKIHDKWRKCELVRLKFHEVLAHDMKTAHEIVERRTTGLVIWRSGSVMVVYRGINYEGPNSKQQKMNNEVDPPFVPNVSSTENSAVKSIHENSSISEKCPPPPSSRAESVTEEAEYNALLDGLGSRFEDWWGTGVLPVDADLLPQKIEGYKTPFRLLPAGMRSRLTNAEMTNLRKVAKSLPCHFALGRNRNHQGLAKAIIKLWEKSLVVKIAVKRGIQNTNNKLMAEEIKALTGGTLLLRNKYYIVIYRGKDFVSPGVAAALEERQQMTKQIQDVEEKVKSGPTEAVSVEGEGALAGTLAEFYEAQARWGREISAEEREKMKEEASRANTMKVIKRVQHKLDISQAKKMKAESLLSKIIASWVPAGPSDDQETITDEERVMFRRVGLKMKAYLPLGIRGVFDGVIENMHLHWKHRELVKLISKEKELAFVEETARLLEYESGGILVALERVPKGYALVYYRGKNYRRPVTLRPRNLLTKAKALKRRVALQRYEALSQHISELERTIEQTKKQIGDSKDLDDTELWNSEYEDQLDSAGQIEDGEDSWIGSSGSEDENDWEDDGDRDSELSSAEEFDEISSNKEA